MIVDVKETELAVVKTELTNKLKDKGERWNPFFVRGRQSRQSQKKLSRPPRLEGASTKEKKDD